MANVAEAVDDDAGIPAKRSKRGSKRNSRSISLLSDDEAASTAAASQASSPMDEQQDDMAQAKRKLKPVQMPISEHSRRSRDEADGFRQHRKGRKAALALRFQAGNSIDAEKVAARVLEDPRFLVSSFHQNYCKRAGIKLNELTGDDVEQYDCPNELCSKGYRSTQGMVNHVNSGNCIPLPEVADVLEEKEKELPYAPAQPLLDLPLRDISTLPAYQLDDKWWTPVRVACQALLALPEDLEDLGLVPRTITPAEAETLEYHKLFTPLAAACRPRVVDADAVLALGYFPEPEASKPKERKFKPKPVKMPVAEEELRTPASPREVRRRVKEAVQRNKHAVSNYNKGLLLEHRRDARLVHNSCLQHWDYPSTRRPTILDYRPPSSRPFALMQGQRQDGYCRFDGNELELYVEGYREKAATLTTGTKSVLQPTDKPRITFDLDQAHQEFVYNRAKRLFGNAKRVMPAAPTDAECSVCKQPGLATGAPEMKEMVTCCECQRSGHPACLSLSRELVIAIRTYPWKCLECKDCVMCGDPENDQQLMFCDQCDRGYHTFCVGLQHIPRGRWVCSTCGQCDSCGTRDPGADRWSYAVDKSGDKKRFYTTLCKPCHRRFEEGHFCPVCVTTYANPPRDPELVPCKTCSRFLHRSCERASADASYTQRCVVCRGLKPNLFPQLGKKDAVA